MKNVGCAHRHDMCTHLIDMTAVRRATENVGRGHHRHDIHVQLPGLDAHLGHLVMACSVRGKLPTAVPKLKQSLTLELVIICKIEMSIGPAVLLP